MEHNLDITYTVSICVLLVFTLVFSAVLSLFTQAKRHEIFGAAAG
jgi:cbb3-type cytochrome oxidase subunit 3